jgi:hypothetical protein
MHSASSVVIALLLAMSVALVGSWPTYALGPDDEQSSAPPASSATSPLLDALAFTPPQVISFQFTDWTALKALHDGSDITSASPLEDRQRLVLDMVHAETRRWTAFGLDQLATWPELWGWDNTDLDWEATWGSIGAPPARVLRFRGDWDPEPFKARLEGYRYSRSEKPHGTLFSDAPYFGGGPEGEAILDTDERLTRWGGSVAISSDGHTVAIGVEGDRADRILKAAARADPAAVATSPFGRVAVALGRPVTAFLVGGDVACSDVGLGSGGLPGDTVRRPPSIDALHPYQAFGIGYERAGPSEPAVGRYAFAYKRAKQAKADLAGRRILIDNGYASRSGRPSQDVALTSGDATPDPRTLVLDVALLDDAPELLFDLLSRRSLSPVACGRGVSPQWSIPSTAGLHR